MKIVAFSDSHGDKESMKLLIEKIQPEMVLYLGDGIDDIRAIEKEYPQLRFEIVKGNCDAVEDAPSEKLISVDGFSFFLTHGDLYGDNLETGKIVEHVRNKGASLLLHGHTHMPTLWTANEITVMNPGSVLNLPGKCYPTCGLIETYNAHFVCKILLPINWIE